jgi:hypothetical protein
VKQDVAKSNCETVIGEFWLLGLSIRTMEKSMSTFKFTRFDPTLINLT